MLSAEQIPRDPHSGLVEGRWGLLLGEPLNHGVAGVVFVEGQSEEMEPRVLTRMVAIFGASGVALARRLDDGGVETVPPLVEVEDLVLTTLQGRTEHPLWDAVVDAIYAGRHQRLEQEEKAAAEAERLRVEAERAAAEAQAAEVRAKAEAEAAEAARVEEARVAAERAAAEAPRVEEPKAAEPEPEVAVPSAEPEAPVDSAPESSTKKTKKR